MVVVMSDTKQPIPGIGDGLRRAQLAAERTYLAWWRTALATVAVAIAIGRLLPEVLNAGTTWPYVVVGAGWGVLAVAIAAYAPVRQRALRRAIDEGGYAHPHTAMLSALSIGGIVLIVASVVLIVISP
jgi:putative membrane protein